MSELPRLGNQQLAARYRKLHAKLQRALQELDELKPEPDGPWSGAWLGLHADLGHAEGKAHWMIWETTHFVDQEHEDERARIAHHQELAQGGMNPAAEAWLSSRGITQGECASRRALKNIRGGK